MNAPRVGPRRRIKVLGAERLVVRRSSSKAGTALKTHVHGNHRFAKPFHHSIVRPQAGAHFVKTSTAYATNGATLDDVRLMHEVVHGRCRVKAAGGIRQIDHALEYLRAGARRFGSTRTEQFVGAFRELSAEDRARFAEYLPPLDSATVPAGVA
jgi:hypothetical protein